MPFAPGGSGDITARLVGKYMEDKTGQPFVVENKAGANGIVGVLSVKSAPADGYTLMLATTSTNAANIHMYKNPGYDPEKDFTVVGVIGSSGAFLVVPADSPHKTLGRPDGLRQGQSRQAQLRLLQCELAGAVGGAGRPRPDVAWQGVAYKAIGNAWNDLYAGAIQFMFVDLTAGARPGGGRQGEAAGHLAARAQPALSRRADPERDLSRLRQHRVPRHRRAQGDAATRSSSGSTC